MLGLVIGMLIECKLKSFALSRFHVKLLSSILISFLITRDCIIYRHFGCFIGLMDKLANKSATICLSDKFGSNMVRKVVKFVSTCILWTFIVNSMLIVVVNPTLLNPGPLNSLKIISFNCQGLLPFSDLDFEHSTLDVTKIQEINYYI